VGASSEPRAVYRDWRVGTARASLARDAFAQEVPVMATNGPAYLRRFVAWQAAHPTLTLCAGALAPREPRGRVGCAAVGGVAGTRARISIA
jgi:hypothetical protein